MKIKKGCDQCKKSISVFPYQIVKQKNHFCSKKCYDKFQNTRPILKCKTCGCDTDKTRKYCDDCLPQFTRKQALKIASLGGKIRWKDHKSCYHANGYIMVKVPNHPFANKRGYVYAHRIEIEKKLGRYLSPTEVVHHEDGDKHNNDISNLVMFRTTNEHTTYHLYNAHVGFKNSRRKDDALRILQSQPIQ